MCRAGDYQCIYRTSQLSQMPTAQIPAPSPSISEQPGLLHLFTEMENRLRRVEQQMDRSTTALPPLDGDNNNEVLGNLTEREVTVQGNTNHESIGRSHHSETEMGGTDQGDSSINPMGILAFADEQVTGYFGKF